jgi:class 3 adenylate cyclase
VGWPRDMTAADLVCGSCGIELPPNSKFCNECGAAVATATTPAEYKQVTVLFADVVRSMDIAAALDVERFREIMTELVERSAAVVQHYGGGSVEYTGDGVMAIFGAPVALEDHAFRACLAALAIQDEANRLAGEVERRDGVALRLRVGLNSGRVIAGEIGSGSLGYAATGEPVGFAQRMESVAPPGGVMLSESTARLVEHIVVLGEPEWVRIKGADEPARASVGIDRRAGWPGRAGRGEPGGSALGDGGPRRPCGPHHRWPRWCGDCGGTAGHRQEPDGPGDGGGGGRSRRRGVLGLLRIPRR